MYDIHTCETGIRNAGFELASEALHLGKRIIAKPLAGQMEQLSNALVIDSLELGMVMKRLNIAKVARFLAGPAGPPVKFPNVALMVADWIESGQWEDMEGLAKKAWQQTALPI